jgi:hypothetical protein
MSIGACCRRRKRVDGTSSLALRVRINEALPGTLLDAHQESEQHVGAEVFKQMKIEAGVVGTATVLFFVKPRQRDQCHGIGAGLLAQAATHFATVDIGQVQFEQRNMRPIRRSLVEGCGASLADTRVATPAVERVPQRLGTLLLVFDHQYTDVIEQPGTFVLRVHRMTSLCSDLSTSPKVQLPRIADVLARHWVLRGASVIIAKVRNNASRYN